MNHDKLPPLPGHPEHGWVWTEAEEAAIRAYAAAAVAAEKERLRPLLEEALDKADWIGMTQEGWDEVVREIDEWKARLRVELDGAPEVPR